MSSAPHGPPCLRVTLTLLALLGLAGQGTAPAAADPTLWPALQPALVTSRADEQRIAALVASMTLEEKVGQMLQPDIASITPADVQSYRFGALLAGGNAAPHGDVRTTPQAWAELVASLHQAALAGGSATHPPVPALFGIDAVHGDAKLLGATIFPHNVGLGAAHDPALIEAIGAATAEEVASTGIDWTFAPTVAVARDVRWGRSYESYAESPELVGRYAAAMVRGLQGAPGSPDFMAPGHTLSSVKHFIGDGATRDGRDQGEAEISEATLARVHAAGYAQAIPAGALIVMASYNSWQGVKANASHYLLTDVLKDRMGFNGFVVGDWNAHEQIAGCTKTRCPAAILAGIDMLMAPDAWKPLYFNTIAEVRSGLIPMTRIDDAVTRILRVKLLSGALERRDTAPRVPLSALGSPAHRALAREAVRRSLVLLKNAHETLPLRARSRVLVVGAAADDIGQQSGGWSIDWQGDHNRNEDFPGATSLYAGIAAAVQGAGGQVELSPDGQFRDRPDVAIVVYGEGPYAEFEGDRPNLQLATGDGHLGWLRRLRAAGIPTVSVLLSGRTLWVNRELNLSDAFVAAWLPGSEGEGLADLLFRAPSGAIAHDFSGRLAFSWPATAQPVQFSADGRVHGALFAAGYGLSYGPQPPLARLDEAARLSPAQDPHGVLLQAGRSTAPWSVYVADALGEVRLTTPLQLAPDGHLLAQRQADGLSAEWVAGSGGLLRIAGRPTDLREAAAQGLSLRVRYRVLTPPTASVQLGLRCAAPYQRHPPEPTPATAEADRAATRCGLASGATVDIAARLRAAPPGRWQQLILPLRCLSRRGADLSNVEAPLMLATDGALALTLGEVRLEPHPELACEAWGSP